jgi:hypothetical protein
MIIAPEESSEAANILDNLFGSSTGDDSEEEGDEGNPKKDVISTGKKLSAVVEMLEVGGNRGLIATCRIPPGVLILAEIPAVTWNDNNENSLEEKEHLVATIQACLLNKLAYQTTKTLYPMVLEDCDNEERERAEALLDSELIKETADKTGFTYNEVLRVLLVLQHNGFESGLYGVLTMLNHSCNPNCIKFSPSTGSSSASEIWTVRQVEENVELTICYCEPLEMTKQSMQEYLEMHHRFSCKCSDCIAVTTLENNAPAEKQQAIIKKSVHDNKLQEIILGMQQELRFLENLDDL